MQLCFGEGLNSSGDIIGGTKNIFNPIKYDTNIVFVHHWLILHSTHNRCALNATHFMLSNSNKSCKNNLA